MRNWQIYLSKYDGKVVPLPAGLNHPANLSSIGSSVAKRLGMSTEEFAELTRENAGCLF